MPRITAEELLERRVSELKAAEIEKKKELSEIQKDLRKNQKALEYLTEASALLRAPNSGQSRSRPKRKKRDVQEEASPSSSM